MRLVVNEATTISCKKFCLKHYANNWTTKSSIRDGFIVTVPINNHKYDLVISHFSSCTKGKTCKSNNFNEDNTIYN